MLVSLSTPSPANIPTPPRPPQGLLGLCLSFSLVRPPTVEAFGPHLPQTCGLINTLPRNAVRCSPVRRRHRRRRYIRHIPSLQGRVTTTGTLASIPINNATRLAQPRYSGSVVALASALGSGPIHAPPGCSRGRTRSAPSRPPRASDPITNTSPGPCLPGRHQPRPQHRPHERSPDDSTHRSWANSELGAPLRGHAQGRAPAPDA